MRESELKFKRTTQYARSACFGDRKSLVIERDFDVLGGKKKNKTIRTYYKLSVVKHSNSFFFVFQTLAIKYFLYHKLTTARLVSRTAVTMNFR